MFFPHKFGLSSAINTSQKILQSKMIRNVANWSLSTWQVMKSTTCSCIITAIFLSNIKSPPHLECPSKTLVPWAPRPRWWWSWTGPAWCGPTSSAAPCWSWSSPSAWSPPVCGGTRCQTLSFCLCFTNFLLHNNFNTVCKLENPDDLVAFPQKIEKLLH